MKRTHLSTGLEKTEYQSQYDEHAKMLLSDKQVLARIMKHTVKEFQEMQIDEIIECIEGEVEVSCHPVRPGKYIPEKISGMNTESKIIERIRKMI